MKESPAENEQGQSVEDVFRNGFAGAESETPSRIWENIDRELENHELHRYKKQAIWYRSLAAAFLLLLLSGGIILWKQDAEVTGGFQNQVAIQQSTPSNNAPAGVDTLDQSKTLNSQIWREATAERARRTEESTERLAAVSKSISRNQAPNRIRQMVSVAQERGSVLAEVESPAKKAMLAKVVEESQTQAEVVAGASVVEKSSLAGEEKKSAQPSLPTNFGDKPFTRSMANSLTISKDVPAGLDSLLAATKRTIMAQKEGEASALAQTQPAGKGNEKEDAAVTKWSVTMAYTPQYAYAPVKLGNSPAMGNAATLNQAQVYQQYQEAVEEYNNSYSPTYSYSTMVGASYKLNDKWQLESGVLYTQNEATTTQSYIVYGGSNRFAFNSPGNMSNNSDMNKSTPLVNSALGPEALNQPIYVTRTNQYRTKYRYQQIGLPLRLAYRVNIKKMYALISGGVNMNLLVQNSIAPETDQVETVTFGLSDEGSPFRTVQWATSTSIGLGYDVTEKMSILVAPEFTYSLTPMVREQQQQANTYQLGLSIGGRWRLTK